ncbi:ABC transporter ATP-binding protein [Faecalicoccus sp.]|uniref:ABC transporter ATP-binding protein n=1 Tax=Faecalicoccus sp. TaxID=1971758 RepID=UPI002A81CAEC|nr:ABC transporter ATP-binding protein [Faecalicoccus sp.]MDY5111424.1 ABC transporter ATP-binding protein [Faecalicoccus sp.]
MLSVINLGFSYNKNQVFKDINFTVYEGQCFVLTGASGSGKSTLLKIINGIIPEVNGGEIIGEVKLDGEILNDKSITDRSSYVSTVFQNPKTQFYCIDSTDELAFPLENRNIPKERILKSIEEYTRLLSTEKLLNRNIFSLSGGEKQLMAITSVMTMDNKVYLFDEPSSSLDHKSIELLKKAIIELKKRGKIVIIAEHRLYYLIDILDSMAILDNSEMAFFPKKELNNKRLYELQNKYLLRSIKEINKRHLATNQHRKINVLNKEIMPEVSDVVLKCENFIQKFKVKKIMDIKSLTFSNGIYFIIGENGVGKSTFIRKLARLIKGTGKTLYKKEEIKRAYNYISMVMQDVNYQIFTESVWKEISIVSNDDGKKKRVLENLNLYDKKDEHPQLLSGGEKQRLMIALAIVSDKPIVILDEPTSGLCKEQMRIIIRYLQKMKNDGKTVIVITHDYEFINECGGMIYEFTTS